MSLPNDLISQFAKLSINQNEGSKESTVYGTTVNYNGRIYVTIDGSDTITPVVSTTEIKAGERVTVLIKDHTATIIGNITNPAASTESVGAVLDSYDIIIAKIGNFETVIADKVSTKTLETELAVINKAIIDKASISELDAVKATIKDLDVSNLQAEIARIDKAIINKADITELHATYAEIDILKGDVADIETLIGGNLTMDNIQSLILTASKVTVDDAFIKDAMIDRVSASKLYAGSINTSLVKLESEDGGMLINGSTQQFKDKDGNVRIQIGRDTSGDFTFILYGADGQGQLINQNGITASAIGDGLIVNDMVSDNAAISGDKLDIFSVVEEINNGTNTIKSTKVYLNEQKQTLEVAFNTLSTTTTNNASKIQANTTKLNTAQGQISSLISNTTITTEDGKTVQLKDQFSTYKQTVDGFANKISSLETQGDNVTSKMAEFETTVNGFSGKLTETEKRIDDMKIGGTNLVNGTSTNVSTYEYAANTTYNVGIGQYVILGDVGVKPGDELTASCYISSTTTKVSMRVYLYSTVEEGLSFQGPLDRESYVESGSTGMIVGRVTVPETITTNGVTAAPYRARCVLYRYVNGVEDIVKYSHLQMEKGNMVTDWGPSIQDTRNSIDAVNTSLETKFAEYDLTIDGLTTRIGKTDSRLETINTQFNQTAESISASVTKNGNDIAALKVTVNGINLDGYVTFKSLSEANSTTVINGSNITTGSISGDRIQGGSLRATEEIGFAGGAVITGGGVYGAALNFSATSYTFNSATHSYLYGNWNILKDSNGAGNLTVEGTTNLQGAVDIDGSVTFDGDATFNKVLRAGDNIALAYGSIYAPNGTKYRDYMRIGQNILQSDSAGILVTATNGAYIPIFASRAEITGDVVCKDVWASGKVYANNVALTSDQRLKTDIRYVDQDTQDMGENGLVSPNVNLTTKDMHEFIELMPLASYRMKEEIENDIDYTYYGFIAQDVLYSKVGSELIEYGEVIIEETTQDEEGRPIIAYRKEERLRYSENKFIAFICGALKEEITQRKKLERQMTELIDIVDQISNL